MNKNEKQRLFQIALNLLNLGNKISKLEVHFNKEDGHRCITVTPSLKLMSKLYLSDSDFNLAEDEIFSQIESNLDEISELLCSIAQNIVCKVGQKMSNGLQALEELSNLANCSDLEFPYEHDVWTRLEDVNKYKTIIEKELESSEYLRKAYNSVVDGLYNISEAKEKQNKIFKIIKEKKVNVGNFVEWLKEHNSYDSYSLDCIQEGCYLHYDDNKNEESILTKEEFELLKEVFNHE